MKRVLVFGHNGMVGRAVVRKLSTLEAGWKPVKAMGGKSRVDLRDPIATQEAVREAEPDAVIVCAGKVGGIGSNIEKPADYVYDNALIQCNTINAAFAYNVRKLITLGSSCIYPRNCRQPMTEGMFLSGQFEPTNQSYAVAKTLGIEMCRALHNQYLMNYFALMPPNLYGPYDNFRTNESHVVASLIRKSIESDTYGELSVWGSGNPTREFMHVDDLASAVEFSLDSVNVWDCDGRGFLNCGTGSACSIASLAKRIIKASGKSLKVVLDKSKPDGMPTKQMSSALINSLGWESSITLDKGIPQAYDWAIKQWESGDIRK